MSPAGRQPNDTVMDAPEPEPSEQENPYPDATESIAAARRLMGPYRGSVKIIRRFVVGIPLWKIETKLTSANGPDYELEVEGDSLDEVAYEMLGALQQVGMGGE